MSMTDPIADFLARIRNAILARQAEVLAPSSKLKQRLCVVLKDEGYIAGYDVRDDETAWPRSSSACAGPIRAPTRSPACAGVRVPGSGCTSGTARSPRCAPAWASRSCRRRKGLMTDRAARKEGLGGELLCEVW